MKITLLALAGMTSFALASPTTPINLKAANNALTKRSQTYNFTACNHGCTATGCGGAVTTFTGTSGSGKTINIPGTECVILASSDTGLHFSVCNKANGSGTCTLHVNLNCFAAEDGSGRQICNTDGTQSIIIPSS